MRTDGPRSLLTVVNRPPRAAWRPRLHPQFPAFRRPRLSMPATLAPSPWPAPAAEVRAGSLLRFGTECELPGPQGPVRGLRWVLRRNCSATPRQLMAVYALLCAVALAVGLGFLVHGTPVVLAFAGIELLAVGAALVVHARHATDRETLTLSSGMLAVEQRCGAHVAHAEFRAAWLAVEPVHGQHSLVQLSGQGRSVRVGRFLRPELRQAFAQELRRALRAAGAPTFDPIPQPTR